MKHLKQLVFSAMLALLFVGISITPVYAGVGFHLGTWVDGENGAAGHCDNTDAVSCGALEIGKLSLQYNWGAWTE